MNLLERLIEIQKALGLSDRKFATLLDIDDSLWTYTRMGKKPIRFEVLRGAIQAFPDNDTLQRDVLVFLANHRPQEALAS